MTANANRLRQYLCLIAAAVLLSLGNLYFGRTEFGGYDLSALIDSGWRVMRGQVPTQSFVCTLPPSFYLLADVAFRLFGVHWISLLLMEDLLYLFLCLIGLRLCLLLDVSSTDGRERQFPWIYVAVQSILIASVNHLWHSTTASGVVAYAALATYTLLREIPGRPRKEIVLHLGLAFMMLVLCKPNTSWPALVLCVVCLAYQKHLWVSLLQALGIAALAATAALAVFGISPYNAFEGYLGLSERIIPRLFLNGFRPSGGRLGEVTLLLTYLCMYVAAFPLFRTLWLERLRLKAGSTDLLGLGAIFISVIGLGTNWDLKIVDAGPFYIGATILAASGPNRIRLLTRPIAYSVGLLLLLAAAMGIGRIRMIEVGSWAGPAFGPMTEIQDRFFGDFRARQNFLDVLAAADRVTSRASRRRVYFGPRMEFLYARDGLPSPEHLPVWWHPGSSYPSSSESQLDSIWENDAFEVLIFAKGDRTRFPIELLRYIDTRYNLDTSSKAIDVFYHR